MKKSKEKKSLELKKANETLKKHGYLYSAGRLYQVKNNKNIEIADYIVIPQKRIKVLGEDEERHLIEFIGYVNGVKQEVKTVESQEIEKVYYINKCWGGLGTISIDSSYKHIKTVVKLLLRETDQYTKLSQMGWVAFKNRKGKTKHVYAHGGGIIGSCPEKILIDESLKEYVINTTDKYTGEEAFKIYMSIFKAIDKSVSYPLVCHTISGLLFSIYKDSGNALENSIYMYADTGNFKSTISYLVSNIHGKPGRSVDHGTFLSTSNDLEAQISTFVDCSTIIDDMHPGVDVRERAGMEEKFTRIARGVGNIAARGRLDRNYKRSKMMVPKSAVIMNGENDICGSASVGARVYSIKLSKEMVNLKKLTYLQNNELALSKVIYDFILWVADNYDNVAEYIKIRYKELRNEVYEELNNQNAECHDRRPHTLILYCISLELFCLKFGVSIKGITKKKAEKKIENAKKVILKGIIEQSQESKSEDPVYMYLSTLSLLQDSNKIVFAPIGKEVFDKRLMGYQDDSYLYVFGESFYNVLLSFYRGRQQLFPLKIKKINEALYEKGIIVPDTSEDNIKYQKKKVFANGERMRLLHIKKDAMKKYLDIDNDEEEDDVDEYGNTYIFGRKQNNWNERKREI